MNLFHFAIWQLMIIAVIGKKRVPKDLKTLTLEIQFPDHVSTIKLWRVNRALANEFLPVWITTNKPGKEFKKLKIMKKVGKVSFFQDTCSKSSLVYYHDRHEIDGVIDVSYNIKRFRINEEEKVQHLDYKLLQEVNRHESTFNSRYERSIDNTTLVRSRRSQKQIFYLELLIAINRNTYQAIEKNSDLPPGVATVSHVLTIYNAADLVYRLLRVVNIQLNIAGIVIEGIQDQWTFESSVMTDSEFANANPTQFYVNANTMHSKISNYFWLWQNTFPRHSYDMIQYLTTSPLMDKNGQIILGQIINPLILDIYMFPPDFFKDRVTAVIQVSTSYKHFITIAHETAHSFVAGHDGDGPLGHLFDEKLCGRTIMSTRAICSSSCLKWSPQAYQEFEEYFGKQPARCNLLNYPRSLDVPRPKIIHSAAAQCECYGYDSILEPDESIPENECGLSILCKTRDSGKQVDSTLPMDGTPCGSKKVNSLLEKPMCEFDAEEAIPCQDSAQIRTLFQSTCICILYVKEGLYRASLGDE